MFVCPAVKIISNLHYQSNIIICADMAASSITLLRVFYTFFVLYVLFATNLFHSGAFEESADSFMGDSG